MKWLCLLFLVIIGVSTSTAQGLDPRCKYPMEPGVCLAAIPRYAFDANLLKCVEFIYGGCGANPNNFLAMGDCKAVCEFPY